MRCVGPAREGGADRDGGAGDRKPRFGAEGDRGPRSEGRGEGGDFRSRPPRSDGYKPRFSRDDDGDRKPRYPRREMILTVISLFLFLTWAIVVLVTYSLKDRR